MEMADIVDTAVAAGSFNTLVAAVQAAGLVDALKGDGPFTVFAPTDEAFAKLPAGTVDDLLKPENKDKLAAVLTYHVVAGKVMAADLSDGAWPTLNPEQRYVLLRLCCSLHPPRGQECYIRQAAITAALAPYHAVPETAMAPIPMGLTN